MFWHYSKAKRAGDLPKRIVSDTYDIFLKSDASPLPQIFHLISIDLHLPVPSSSSQGVPKVQILLIRQVEKREPIAFLDQLRRSISARVFTPENSVEQACEY